MNASRFRAGLALTTLLGLTYLVHDYVSSRVDPVLPLSGTVMIDGKPMSKGIVRFISLDPNSPKAYGSTIKDGRYEVPAEYGITPARYQVEFSSITAEDVQRLMEARGGAAIASDTALDVEEEVPARFNRNSEIEVDLSSGSVVQADFDLR